MTPERAAVIAELLTRCFTTAAIVATCSKQWALSDRVIRKYIGKVRASWVAQGVQASRDERAFSRSRNKAALEAIAAKMMGRDKATHEDLAIAIKALTEINRMDGHHVKRIEMSGPGGGPIAITARAMAGMTDDELETWDRLAAKAMAAQRALPPSSG